MSMLCPECHTDLPNVEGADVRICKVCQSSSSSKKKRRRVPELTPDTPGKTKFRVDSKHLPSKEIQLTDQALHVIGDRAWLGKRPVTHGVLFGLLVFLVGQVVHVWAFLAGNYFAWSTANFMSTIGVTVALFTAATTIRSLQHRIESLALLVGRNEVPTKSRRSPKLENIGKR